MNVPLRRDSEFGLTAAQFAKMPERLTKKAASTEDAAEAARLKADADVWAAAAKQLAAEGSDGKWSIVWAKVGSMKEADGDEDGQPTFDGDDDDEEAEDDVVADTVAEASVETLLAEVGRRNSAADLSAIQSAHDALVKVGAACSTATAEADIIEMASGSKPEPFSVRESGWGGIDVTFAEADPEFDRANREVWITPIRPGPGNKRDRMYYPERTLREAVEAGRFNGIKMFANHPTKSGEKELPERSVRDWVGVIKETVWDAARRRPRSRLKVLDQDVYDRFEAAPEHIAFSVLGNGRARPGTVNGEERRIVEAMDRVRSVDWVTEAGAGGSIDFAESADEEFDVELTELTVAQVREGNPDLYAAIREDEAPAKAEADSSGEPEKAEKPEAKAKADDTPAAPEGYVSKADYDAVLGRLSAAEDKISKAETKESQAEAREAASYVVDRVIKASLLPRPAKEFVAARFAEAAIGAGMHYADEDALEEALGSEIEAVRKVLKRDGSNVRGLGTDSEQHPQSLRESKEASISARLGEEVLPTPRDDGEEGTAASADTAKAGKWAEDI